MISTTCQHVPEIFFKDFGCNIVHRQIGRQVDNKQEVQIKYDRQVINRQYRQVDR